MDEWTADTFIANREDPIPVMSNDGASSDRKRKPGSDKANQDADKSAAASPGKHTRSQSLQDRLLNKVLQQVIPSLDEFGGGGSTADLGPAAAKHLDRPGFSLPLMTNNFRRFNARIGVVFVFQAKAIKLFTWRRHSHTFSFLAVYSLVCLYPHLLAVLPLCIALLSVFVPAYLARHPPPPDSSSAPPQYTLSGPPLAPARVIKPANEMSRDFFHNMRDLQNSMDDFSVLHDALLDAVTPLTNFSREALSSTLFVLLVAAAAGLFLISPLLPWRHLCLLAGWATVSLGHPRVQALAQSSFEHQIRPPAARAGTWLQRWSAADISLDEDPEVLEVEIFELQRRRGRGTWSSGGPAAAATASGADDESESADGDDGYEDEGNDNGNDRGKAGKRKGSNGSGSSGSSRKERTQKGARAKSRAVEWEGWLFSASPWEPQAPARIAGERPKGTRFFEDVRPPEGWEWGGKKWVLDLASQEWVEQRILGGLEVEVEGERWVYDMSEARRAEFARRSNGSNGGEKGGSSNGGGTMLEGADGASAGLELLGRSEGRGEWRRRRWVRWVKRKKVKGEAGTRVWHTGGK